MREHFVPDQASVHKEENGVPVELLHMRAGDQSVERELCDFRLWRRFRGCARVRRHVRRRQSEFECAAIDVDQIGHQFRAEDLEGTFSNACDRRDVEQFPPLMDQLESLVYVPQAVVSHERADVREFRLIGSQKLLACRNVEEQIPNT